MMTVSTSSSVSASRPLPFGTNESIGVKVLMSVIQYSVLGAWAKLGRRCCYRWCGRVRRCSWGRGWRGSRWRTVG
ncbi:putative clathrin assembly protein isoform X1 [Iris pallida]|uniref:Clathrin assembly protein isoform X1 n=1 Tax=Iris pallida TaxID=29817 RepID=A0AAX6H6Q6_IRIPA|nr:putative clathrin assembly protein isoform X1 [Iris pallida]